LFVEIVVDVVVEVVVVVVVVVVVAVVAVTQIIVGAFHLMRLIFLVYFHSICNLSQKNQFF
jgi:hypothetical protein